jgi:hypothetical protein
MITFGLVMLIGNLAFVRPETTRAVLCWLFRRSSPPVAIRTQETRRIPSVR